MSEARSPLLRGQCSSPGVAGTPIGRWGTPMEIALTADFLVSRAAGFITGHDVKFDGGSLASAQLASREAWLEALRQSLAN